jgi:glucose-1-phosphate cytidylyltransferase
MLEREPMEKLVELDQLRAYKHDGFWHCMDTKRDHELLEELWSKGNAIWNF